MAQQVYSVRLWALQQMAAAGTAQGPGPPPGFVWIVRDVRFIQLFSSGGTLRQPVVLTTAQGVYIASSPSFASLTDTLYQWQGRAVVSSGDSLVVSSQTQGWQVVVDGYQLSTP